MAFTADHAKRMRSVYQNDAGKHVVQMGTSGPPPALSPTRSPSIPPKTWARSP